jgi:hypothetical protein
MTQPPAGLLAMLTGGAPLPLPTFPCAHCLATLGDPDYSDDDGPNTAETIVAGTLVCRVHVREALDAIDNGQIAGELVNLHAEVAHTIGTLDDARRSLDTIAAKL